MKLSPIENIIIQKIIDGKVFNIEDKIAVEEPLEIQLTYSSTTGKMIKKIAVTMRTPGNDEELAAGFLFTEGVISKGSEILEIKQPSSDESIIMVTLHEGIIPHLTNTARNFYSTSSCGICGKASIDAIKTTSQFINVNTSVTISSAIVYNLPYQLKQHQKVFEDTGGIHACALFSLDGKFFAIREDVGRHNALDKLIGASFRTHELPLSNKILFLSGRASFELVQKAAMAGIKIIVAVGAASSLAVELADEMNITLIGFLRNDRFNVYTRGERINL